MNFARTLRPGSLALASAMMVRCSVVNHIDTCDTPRDRDFQVNAQTSGDQYPTHGRSLARLPSGVFVAAWASESSTVDGAPSELRAGLFQADGTVVPPCGSVAGDTGISVATDETVGRPAVAVGPTADSPVYFAWRAAPSGVPSGSAVGRIRVRLMRQDLCPWNTPPNDTLVLEASDGAENAAAPVVAVRSDGLEAQVAWISIPPQVGQPDRVRIRPVGVSTDRVGRVEMNGCDGTEAPCTLASTSLGSAPTIVAFGQGYGVAWGEARADARPGFDVRLDVLDAFGVVTATGRGARSFGDVLVLDLASASDAQHIVLAEAAEPRAETPPAAGDTDVYVERFGSDARSTGAPVRVNGGSSGSHVQPALGVLSDGGTFVTWTTRGSDGMSSALDGRWIDADGAPLFSGLVCDTTDFRVSSSPDVRASGPSVDVVADTAVVLFGASGAAPGGTDALGLSVHARRFDLAHLAPQLR